MFCPGFAKRLSISLLLVFGVGLAVFASSCQPGSHTAVGKKTIVVTYSVLGSVVRELVGGQANVVISIPNGQDPHEWEPSAKDIEAINKADLVVENGLGLEGGMKLALEEARSKGVRIFTASDHITIRYVGAGEGIPSGDPDQAIGAPDPHLWTDPVAMKDIVGALASEIKQELNLDVTDQAQAVQTQLDNLNNEISSMVSGVPEENRRLVTGHESLGYFAQRYGFKLVGAIIPSLTTQAEVSAGDLAALKVLIQENRVKVIFTELGTSPAVASAIGKETGARVVELSTHVLPGDGSYFTFMSNMAQAITSALS